MAKSKSGWRRATNETGNHLHLLPNGLECVSPVRVVTASVAVRCGNLARASVKTSAPVDKALVMCVMNEIHGVSVSAPVHIGDILVRNIAGSGANLLATRGVDVAP